MDSSSNSRPFVLVQPSTSPARPTFMALPIEIHHKIYSILLSSPHIIYIDCSRPCTASHSHGGPLISLSQTNHQLQLSIDTWFSNLAPLIKTENGWLSKEEEPSFGIMNKGLTMLLSSDQPPFGRAMSTGRWRWSVIARNVQGRGVSYARLKEMDREFDNIVKKQVLRRN